MPFFHCLVEWEESRADILSQPLFSCQLEGFSTVNISSGLMLPAKLTYGATAVIKANCSCANNHCQDLCSPPALVSLYFLKVMNKNNIMLSVDIH